ncbi:restriction endonuclease subunit S [Nocardia cyriacigeorgica]|uniref:restriction endonuclease subunit S n=1 Tax=Nocardia cyriacigeorgica TaxID=135487 RepID=UPI000CEA2505|nr:restriction endonuclease subunit S [Nocardia cyriacigeorgica]PPJ02257.1 hypothetical protein C5E43_26830 [Nocardia cyriacigeorgica]
MRPKSMRLGDVTTGVSTWNPSRTNPDDEFTYIDLSAIDQSAKIIAGPQRIVGSDAPSRARQLIHAGDILVSTVRPNLNAVAQVPEELDGATASTGFTVLRPSNSVDSRYIFQWVRTPSFVSDMVSKSTGASYPAVSDRIVKDSFVPLPPIEEQRRIAGILDHADALRAKRREALARLDELTQSIFIDMFGDREACELGGLLDFVTSGGRGWSKYYANEGEAFVRSLDVRMNRIDSSDIAYVNAPDNAEARRTRTRSGDVLLTITGSCIGRAAPVGDTLAGAYVSQHVAILRPHAKVLESRFLSAFLCHPSFGQRQIAKAQYGQTKPGLNFEQIRAFRLPKVSRELQRRYVNRAAALDSLTSRHETALAELDALFASLQSRAFRGDL